MKSVKTKTRINVSPKVAISVVLVVASIAVGGYLLNMAGALTPSSAGNSSWEYVYGPDKCSQSSLNNIISSIASGADVKVFLMDSKKQQQCVATQVNAGDPNGSSVSLNVTCYLSEKKTIHSIESVSSRNFVLEDDSMVIINGSANATERCNMHYRYLTDQTSTSGNHIFSGNGDTVTNQIKWFVRR